MKTSLLLAVASLTTSACAFELDQPTDPEDLAETGAAGVPPDELDGAEIESANQVVRVDHDGYLPRTGDLQVVLETEPFVAVAGEKYRAYGVLAVDTRPPYHTAELSYGMGSGNLTCGSIEGVGFVENTIPDSDAYLQRLGFVLTGDGSTITCKWRFEINDDPNKRYQLAPGSFIAVHTAAPDAYHFRSTQFSDNPESVRLARGESAHVAHANNATLVGRTVFVGDLQMNGCRGIDPGTACLSTDWSEMVTATAELKVSERKPGISTGDDWCAVTTVFTRSRRFKSSTQASSPGQHHATVHGSRVWNPTPGCGSSAYVEFRARNDTSEADCAMTPSGDCAIAMYSRNNLYASVPQTW